MMTWKYLFLVNMFPFLLKWNWVERAASMMWVEQDYCPSPSPCSIIWVLPFPWVLVTAGYISVLCSALLGWGLSPRWGEALSAFPGGLLSHPSLALPGSQPSSLSLWHLVQTFTEDSGVNGAGRSGWKGPVWITHTSGFAPGASAYELGSLLHDDKSLLQ